MKGTRTMWKFLNVLPSPTWEEPDPEAGSALTEAVVPEPASALTEAEGTPPAAEPTAPPAAEDLPPISQDTLTFPEGMEVPEGALDGFLEIMNEADLPREELAQKLIDLQIEATARATEASDEAAQTLWNETQAQWQQEMKDLPQIGGEHLDASLAAIKKGLIQAGATEATFTALDLTGAGNHPEIIRMLFELTKPLQESSLVSGEPPTGKLSLADKLYGGQT